MLKSSSFALYIHLREVYSIDSSKMMGRFPEVLNFIPFICNYRNRRFFPDIYNSGAQLGSWIWVGSVVLPSDWSTNIYLIQSGWGADASIFLTPGGLLLSLGPKNKRSHSCFLGICCNSHPGFVGLHKRCKSLERNKPSEFQWLGCAHRLSHAPITPNFLKNI